jgi:hypothetical protein
MLVLAVGQHSQVGMIYKLLHEVKKEIHDKKTQSIINFKSFLNVFF